MTRGWPPLSCSSSNTVGSVRTGIPRLWHAVTTRRAQRPWSRRNRDHDLVGLDLVEDSGESQLGLAVPAVPRTRRPYSSFIPSLRGSSSTKPTGRIRSCRVPDELANDEPSALAGTDDQHISRALGDPECSGPGPPRPGARQSARRPAAPSDSKHEQDDHAARQADRRRRRRRRDAPARSRRRPPGSRRSVLFTSAS